MRQSIHFSKIIKGDTWKQETVTKHNNFGKEDFFKVYNWVNIKKYFYKMLIFLKTIKGDNESDTTELADDLCDVFSATIISRNSEKNIIWVERLFNCCIDSLHENCNVTINFNWILSLSIEQRNWGLNKLEYSSGKPSAIRAQPRAQSPSALSSNCLRLPRTIL